MAARDIIADSQIYSSEQKNDLAGKLSNTELNDYILLFRTTSKYETFFEKDVLYFTRSQLIAMFEDLESTASTFEKRYTLLKRYFGNSFRKLPEISFDELDVYQSLRRRSIRDFQEFLYIINHSFQTDDMQTLDVIRKSCVILLYMGISKSEITEVKKSDFDEAKGTIVFTNSKITRSNIPTELISVLTACKKMDSYVPMNPKRSEEQKKKLQQNDYLIRHDAQGSKDKCSVIFIDKIFQGDRFAVVDKDLTPTRIIESGLFHWLYKKESEGIEFTTKKFQILLKEYFAKPISKYQQYFQNYKSWKTAFKL